MSVQNVRAAIERFLASSEPQVLCIRGAWGTGKTFTWKDVAEKQRDKKDGITLRQYAYVSLFGLNTMQEMKIQIVQNTTTTAKIGDFISEETLRDALDKAEGPAKKAAMWLLQAVMGNRFDSAIAAMSAMISKQIIVFDDLERKGGKLSNADVFGFASYLKEERKCKVVLLLNDEMLNVADKATFNAYLEKVVDISVKFDPTRQEIADIAVPAEGRNQLGQWVHDFALKLGMDNIRVIRKILALTEDVAPMLKDYAPSVTENAAGTITLLGWSYFQPETAPPLDYLKVASPYFASKGNIELDGQWRDLLLAYHYTHFSKFDEVLLTGIINGYFDKADIDKHAAELHNADILGHVEQELRQVWDGLNNSFTKPINEVLEDFYRCFEKNKENISLSNMAQVIAVFEENGDGRSSDIVDQYIAVNAGNPDAFDLDHLERFGHELPEPLKIKLREAGAPAGPEMTPAEVLKALHGRGYERELFVRASTLSVGDYVNVFKTHEGKELAEILMGVRQYLNVGNLDPEIEKVMDRAGEALREIATENPVNYRRAMRQGLVQRLEEREAGRKQIKAIVAGSEADSTIPAVEGVTEDDQTVG